MILLRAIGHKVKEKEPALFVVILSQNVCVTPMQWLPELIEIFLA